MADSLTISAETLIRVLGGPAATLIQHIAQAAQAADRSLFLVGGLPRDLLLGRKKLDFDFVLESDATAFAAGLARAYGGHSQAHTAFGTAKWTLNATVADRLRLPAAELPQHIDFARARRERYAYPAALPTVSPSDIRRDLWRRDFSVNTLALQLSPAAQAGQLLDICGGQADLRQRQIRILHQRSFIDDPTRILRALRFAHRLDFKIERQTEALLGAALPWLDRVSGARLCNEFELILREPRAGAIALELQERGLLAQIQPNFSVSPQLPDLLERIDQLRPPWPTDPDDRRALRWNMLLAESDADAALAICARLALTQKLTHSICAAASLRAQFSVFNDPASRPSEITQMLDGLPPTAIQAAWLLLADRPAAQAQLSAYMTDWRKRQPTINGNDLKKMGLAPSPRFKEILNALRYAWIDGAVDSAEAERALLERLLAAQE